MAFETHRAKPLPGQNPAADALVAGAESAAIPPASSSVHTPPPGSPSSSTPSSGSGRAEPLHMMLKLPPAMAEKLQRAFDASSRGEGRGKNAFVVRLLDEALTRYLADKAGPKFNR